MSAGGRGMPRIRRSKRIWIAVVAAAAGCSGGPSGPPRIPLVEGPLRPHVVSPAPEEALPAAGTYTVYGAVGNGRATLTINGIDVPVLPNGAFLARAPVPDAAAPHFELVAALRGDTTRVLVPVRIGRPVEHTAVRPGFLDQDGEPAGAESAGSHQEETWGVLVDPRGTAPHGEAVVVGRPEPDGPFTWFLLPGTRVPVTGTDGNFIRVRLDSRLQVWVRSRDVGRSAPMLDPVRLASQPRVVHSSDWADVVIPMNERPAFQVEEVLDGLVLTLYGTRLDSTRVSQVPGGDPWVRGIETRQLGGDRALVRILTASSPYGYEARWEDRRFVLRIRRPPRIHRFAPLRGLVIAVDPGHPPHGAVGPTGTREDAVTLAVALRLRKLLEARGAKVVLTRSDSSPTGLGERTLIAHRAGAHALVSIHVDARPGEVDPYAASGTRTYYFHPHSLALGQAVQAGMVRRLGLGDQGIIRRELALVRPTWMPAVLCEGAMLILPEHEAALQTPEYQRAYAQGIADGLEEFFRSIDE